MGTNPGTWAPAGGISMHSMNMMVMHTGKMVNGFMFSGLIGLSEAKLIVAEAVDQSNRMEGANQGLIVLNGLLKVNGK
jgi:hypothetical protein